MDCSLIKGELKRFEGEFKLGERTSIVVHVSNMALFKWNQCCN